jgi:feruloyl esterase
MFSARPLVVPAIALGLAGSVATTAGSAPTSAIRASRTLDASCAGLVGRTDMRLRTVVASETGQEACHVTGELRPAAESRIGFELWLPTAAAWTGRLVMLGNGGYSSSVPLAAMMRELGRGSAVVATDTGHQGDDPDFARGRPQAIIDWGWRAVHLSAVAARTLATHFYGRAPHHRYFNGCSTGGHQALMEAQRFPRDFDGIVAGAPGAARVRLNAGFLWQYLSNHPRGRWRPTSFEEARDQPCRGARACRRRADGWIDTATGTPR